MSANVPPVMNKESNKKVLDQISDAETQNAWAEEVRRRLADLDSGSVKTVFWDEARQVIAG
jgi:hypothetical protein